MAQLFISKALALDLTLVDMNPPEWSRVGWFLLPNQPSFGSEDQPLLARQPILRGTNAHEENAQNTLQPAPTQQRARTRSWLLQ
jgi:hypothetical protein